MDLLAELFDSARQHLRKVVLPEGDDERVLAAACRLRRERIAIPIVLGDEAAIAQMASRAAFDVSGIEVIDPRRDARLGSYASACAAGRATMTPGMAARLVAKPLYFAGMMVRQGDADAMIAGAANPTRRGIEAGLMTIGLAAGIALPSSFFLIVVPDFLGRGPKAFGSPIAPSMQSREPRSSPTSRSHRRSARRSCCAGAMATLVSTDYGGIARADRCRATESRVMMTRGGYCGAGTPLDHT